MDNDPPIPPPTLPAPVLNYETGRLPTYFWLARLLCGMAIMHGAVSAGYIVASHMPGRDNAPGDWTDIPIVVAGLMLIIFGTLADTAIIPVFLVVCLSREPVREYFAAQG
jgi:hypothetical protein